MRGWQAWAGFFMPKYLILFLGRANAGRTLMAEALVLRWGAPRFKSVSAGLEPAAGIDPVAAVALREELHATPQTPKLLSELLQTLDGTIDLVITLDSVTSGLGIPGNPPVVQWNVDDPRLHTGGEKDRIRAWRGVLRDLEGRIKLLATLLPQGLDEFLLRQRTLDAHLRVDRTASLRM